MRNKVPPSSSPVTQLLDAVGRGDSAAQDKLWGLIYNELHAMARGQLADEATGHRRRPTSLVHEVYLRLMGSGAAQWANRKHFFQIAAKAMRRIRLDDARTRKRLKRGGGKRPVELLDAPAEPTPDPTQVLAIDEALEKLEEEEPQKAEVVLLRYYAGLSIDEVAAVLEVSPRTVDNHWRFARAWLHRELQDPAD